MGQRDGKNSYWKKRVSAHFIHVSVAIDYLHVRGLSNYSVIICLYPKHHPRPMRNLTFMILIHAILESATDLLNSSRKEPFPQCMPWHGYYTNWFLKLN